MEERHKFSPTGFVGDVLRFYTDNLFKLYKLLFFLFLIYLGVGIGFVLINMVIIPIGFSSGNTWIGILVGAAYIIFALCVSVKILVMSMIGFDSIAEGRELSLGEINSKSKGLSLPFFGNMLLVALIAFIPLAITMAVLVNMVPSYQLYSTPSSLTGGMVIGSIIMLGISQYIYVRLGFAPYIRILRSEKDSCFDYNKLLVKGNVARLYIAFVIFALCMQAAQLGLRFLIDNVIIVSIISIILSFVLTPIYYSMPIIAIRNLEKCAGINRSSSKKDDFLEE